MNSSWRFLVGLVAVGLHAGLTAAQAPGDGPLTALAFPVIGEPAITAPQVRGQADIDAPIDGAAPGERTGIIAGVGLYLIQPYFQNNPAYTVFVERTQNTVLDPTMPATTTLGERAIRENVSHHMDIAPLVWLGYMGEDGFGGRVRWWSFRQGTSQTVNLPPFAGTFNIVRDGQTIVTTTGDLFTVTSAAPLGLMAFGDTFGIQHGPEAVSFNVTTKLALQVFDLEAMQEFQASSWNFLLAGGLRLARIDQAYNVYDSQSFGPIDLRTLLSSYRFEGVGPTLDVEARRSLGDSGLTAYSTARGSLVFGSARQNASFGGPELRNDDPNPQLATQHRDRALPIADLEVGVEYGQALGSSWLFGQVGLVGQEWFGAGSASRSTMLTPATTLRPVLGGASLDSNIAFFGLSLRVGMNY